MTAAELRASRAAVIAKARQLVDAAAAAKRDMTLEENDQFANMMNEADGLGLKIRSAEQKEWLDEREAELRTSQGRRSAAGQPAANRETGRTLDADQAGELFRAWTLAGSPIGRPNADTLQRAAEFGLDLNNQVLTIPATRAMSKGTTTAGGHTVPSSFSSEMERILLYYFTCADAFDMFATENGQDYPWPTVDDTANSGELLAEAGGIAVNQDPTFGQIVFKAWDWYSPIVKVSHQLLRDSAQNIPGVLAELFAERFGRKLDSTTVSANAGTTAPEGVLNGVTAGVNLATGNAITVAKLLALETSVPLAYRNLPGVGFLMHDATWSAIRALADSTGRLLVNPDLQSGTEKRLLGYQVHLSNNMTSIASPTDNSVHILFGALKKYKVRRVGGSTITRLNELYAGNGQVGFVQHQSYDGRWITKAGVRTLNAEDTA